MKSRANLIKESILADNTQRGWWYPERAVRTELGAALKPTPICHCVDDEDCDHWVEVGQKGFYAESIKLMMMERQANKMYTLCIVLDTRADWLPFMHVLLAVT
jgi:hypothetical protein